MEERRLRIPYDTKIRADLRSVAKQVTIAGNVRFTAERTADGHADHFWALALAVHAASNPTGPVEYQTVARRRFADRKGAW
jgi:phage FluMu gp28-like protein